MHFTLVCQLLARRCIPFRFLYHGVTDFIQEDDRANYSVRSAGIEEGLDFVDDIVVMTDFTCHHTNMTDGLKFSTPMHQSKVGTRISCEKANILR